MGFNSVSTQLPSCDSRKKSNHGGRPTTWTGRTAREKLLIEGGNQRTEGFQSIPQLCFFSFKCVRERDRDARKGLHFPNRYRREPLLLFFLCYQTNAKNILGKERERRESPETWHLKYILLLSYVYLFFFIPHTKELGPREGGRDCFHLSIYRTKGFPSCLWTLLFFILA